MLFFYYKFIGNWYHHRWGTLLRKDDNEQHVMTKTEIVIHCEKKGKLKGTGMKEGDAL
jgi:hypothetical protein